MSQLVNESKCQLQDTPVLGGTTAHLVIQEAVGLERNAESTVPGRYSTVLNDIYIRCRHLLDRAGSSAARGSKAGKIMLANQRLQC